MIILTGAKGFIGKNFLKNLDNVIEVDQENCWQFLRTFKDWKKVNLILHQGAISSTVEKDINKIHSYNVDYTLLLFEFAIRHGIPVRYASSASVYGNLQGIYNPLNYYAISKLQIDYWVYDNLDKFSSIQGFRYFNVYGNHEDHKGDQASPISKFSKQIKETRKLRLFEGSDNYLRDFICVDDVVNIVLHNQSPSGIYDLGTGNPISFQKIAELIVEKKGGEIEYIPFPKHLVGKYQNYTKADISWMPEYKFITVEDYINRQE